MSTHGSVSFFPTPLDAAYQAAADAQRFAAALGTARQGPADGVVVTAAASIAVAGAIAFGAGVIANVAGAILGIVDLVTDSDNDPVQNSLEVEIVNNTSQSLVLYNYTPAACDVTQIAMPLLPTASDTFLVTSGTVGTFRTTTTLTLNFLLGASSNTIETDVTLNYTGTAWSSSLTVDSVAQPAPVSTPELTGAQFLGNSGFPSFCAYITPITTPSGKMTLAFYDTAAA